MKFWDASAVVPLIVEETVSRQVTEVAKKDPEMIVWWGAEIECISAFARLEREQAFDSSQMKQALESLQSLKTNWHEVLPQSDLRSIAIRLLRVHPLRAADALQLAAAITAAESKPETLDFICFDSQLNQAATREGFRVL